MQIKWQGYTEKSIPLYHYVVTFYGKPESDSLVHLLFPEAVCTPLFKLYLNTESPDLLTSVCT